MTAFEIELSKKILHAQEEVLRVRSEMLLMKLRMDAMEAVVEGMSIRQERPEGMRRDNIRELRSE